ncbi:MAG: hypothetical protein FWE08_04630 [Oscillospiraceae bacterium]|nr:hypothetical protein [Oscillospiraceae bacterium]
MRNLVNKLLDNRLVYLLISIVAAFMIWLWVVNIVNPSDTRNLTFQIQYEGLGVLENYNLRLSSDMPDRVTLRVEASATDMIRVEQNLQIIVDVSGISEAGEHDVAFRPAAFNIVPSTVSFRSVQPGISNTENTIIVRTNRITGRTVTLETTGITYEIAESDGDYVYVGERRSVYPESIQIDGPEEILSRIDTIEVVADFAQPLSSTTTQPGTLRVYDHDGAEIPLSELQDVFFSHETVSVTVPVRMMRSVPLRPVFEFGAGANEDNVEYSLNREQVWLIGEGDMLRNLEYLELPAISLNRVAVVDVVRLDIPTPPLTELYDGPDWVDVNIQIQDVSERTMSIPRARIGFIGTPDGVIPSVAIDTITLVIRGPAEILEELDENDISVIVNLSDYEGQIGRFGVEEFTVLVDDWPSEVVGAMILQGQGIIVNIQRG